jgi:hypothetical protein
MTEEIQKTVYDEQTLLSDRFTMINKAFSKSDKNIATVDFNKINDYSMMHMKYSKEQLIDALSTNSEQNTKILIQASNYFYTRSGEYRQLLHRFAGIHKYRNVIYPRFQFDKKANVKKINDKLAQYVLNSRIEETCTNITLKALLDGTAYTYEEIKDGDKTVQQFLPSDYCRTRTMDSFGNKIVEFNFKYFDEKYPDKTRKDLIFKQLPKEFLKLYNDYKAGKNNIGDTLINYWQQLDTDCARASTFSLDGTPYFCAIFPDLLDYESYKALNKLSSELDLFTILVQKAEFDKDGNLSVDDDTMDRLASTLSKVAKSGGCGSFTTPFKVEALKVKDNNEKKIDYVQTGLTGIYNSSSLPEISFNSSSKNGGTAGLNASNQMSEGIFDIILSQYKNWYFKKLGEISAGKIVFDIDFITITCFNEKDKIGIYKEQFSLGGSAFYYFAAIGINQFEIASLLAFENELGIKGMLEPPQSTYTTSGEDKSVGAIEKDDEDKADSTLIQQDNGVDQSRAVV